MRYERKKAGLSPLVAVILLVAITVAAALVVSGVFFNLANIAGRRPSASLDYAKLVVLPSGDAVWAITIKNTGDIRITDVSASFSGCAPDPFTFSPSTVPPGTTTAASGTATGCNIGETYYVTLTVTFGDGSQQTIVTAATGSAA
jgi:FlaG/FlaF family flagellin (archaellin)